MFVVFPGLNGIEANHQSGWPHYWYCVRAIMPRGTVNPPELVMDAMSYSKSSPTKLLKRPIWKQKESSTQQRSSVEGEVV